MHYMQKAPSERQQAEEGIKIILAKLKAGNYKNAFYEETDRKLLAIYLTRV